MLQYWNFSFLNLNKYAESGTKRYFIWNSFTTYKEISLETYKYKSRFSVFPSKIINAAEYLMKGENLIPYDVNQFQNANKIKKLIKTKINEPFIFAIINKDSRVAEFNKLRNILRSNGYKCSSLKESNAFKIFECKIKS